MTLRIKSKKILIPDVPPPLARTTKQGLVIAGIGGFCASVVVAAALLFFSARKLQSGFSLWGFDRVNMKRIFRIFSLAVVLLLVA